jgi:hypothetical protein
VLHKGQQHAGCCLLLLLLLLQGWVVAPIEAGAPHCGAGRSVT